MTCVLHIDASARHEKSRSRAAGAVVAAALAGSDGTIVQRDLTDGVPLLNPNFVKATFTAPEDRDRADREALAISDTLVDEIEAADVLVIASPIYNFGVPGALKAWIDQVARVGRTFRYTADGPVGLVQGKRAVVVLASGGTQIGSDIDFASGYLRHFLGFLGITEVEIRAAREVLESDAKAA